VAAPVLAPVQPGAYGGKTGWRRKAIDLPVKAAVEVDDAPAVAEESADTAEDDAEDTVVENDLVLESEEDEVEVSELVDPDVSDADER